MSEKSNILLHPDTMAVFDRLLNARPQSIMISGSAGSGKTTIAISLVGQLLEIAAEKVLSSPVVLWLAPEKSIISIEQIRTMQQFLQLKTTGDGNVRRVIVIEAAHTMPIEAQNALLKTLEEPPADTVIMLLTDGDKGLKPTIYSRVTQMRLLPVRLQDAVGFFKRYNEAEIAKAYALSGGKVGLLSQLLEGDETQPFIVAIAESKVILGESKFDRLKRVDELSKDKQHTTLLLQALSRVAESSLQHTAKNNPARVTQWHHTLKSVHQAQTAMSAQTNAKLVLTDLFIEL